MNMIIHSEYSGKIRTDDPRFKFIKRYFLSVMSLGDMSDVRIVNVD